jgi:hypothetical protein
MIINAPGNDVPTIKSFACTAGSSKVDCLRPGSTVEVYLPGQTQAAYSFKVDDFGNPSTPYGVEVTKDQPPPSNLGRTFFENLNYLYDPINGFVGYQASGKSGRARMPSPPACA